MNFKKKKRVNLFISLVLLLVVIIGASIIGVRVGNTNAEIKKNTQPDLYELTTPEDWSIRTLPFSSLSFEKNGNVIGGVDVVEYYPDQPIYQLRSNHTEVIESKKLEGYFTEAVLEKLKQTPPAASGDLTVTESTHIYFILKDKNKAYDLHFKTQDVDEQTALTIAKSLKLK